MEIDYKVYLKKDHMSEPLVHGYNCQQFKDDLPDELSANDIKLILSKKHNVNRFEVEILN